MRGVQPWQGHPDGSRGRTLRPGDKGPREAVARLLEKLDLEPVILEEQANQGRAVIEKFEANVDVAFAASKTRVRSKIVNCPSSRLPENLSASRNRK
jgi:hypothetical protein